MNSLQELIFDLCCIDIIIVPHPMFLHPVFVLEELTLNEFILNELLSCRPALNLYLNHTPDHRPEFFRIYLRYSLI